MLFKYNSSLRLINFNFYKVQWAKALTTAQTHYHNYILFSYNQNTKSYFIYSKHSQKFFNCLVMFFEYHWYF